MKDLDLIYNSRILKIYVQYLEHAYPEVNINRILGQAGLSRAQIEDSGCWLTQSQVDAFEAAAEKFTNNPDIARHAGRFATSSEGLGAIREYAIGFTSLPLTYSLIGKLYGMMSRGASVTSQKIGRRKVEIIAKPAPGVQEKPYQCNNRIGTFESIGKLFTKSFSKVEHPECIHKGGSCCRYVVTWENPPYALWQRLRNFALGASIASAPLAYYFLAPNFFLPLYMAEALLCAVLAAVASAKKVETLEHLLEQQGDTAAEHIKEIRKRYDSTVLVQEIGQAVSSIRNLNQLLPRISAIMEERLGFDRGAIWLANDDDTLLEYRIGYGYGKEKEELLRNTPFHLTKKESRGPFVAAFRKKKPILIENVEKHQEQISPRSLLLAKVMHAKSLICVPIVYENQSLGVLCVDNLYSELPLTQSDLNLLVAVASQIGVSIMNAKAFEDIRKSEKKYRELIESANSVILRVNKDGVITFCNRFGINLFGYSENELLGKHVMAFFPDNPKIKSEVEEVLEEVPKKLYGHFVREGRCQSKEGKEIWVTWTFRPIFDKGGKFQEILCIGNDVTELKASEIAKKELSARLERAKKMEAVGTLAGGVAHDLNNILSGLVSYPDLLLAQLPEDSPMRKPIMTIQKSGEKAARIVQDLLTLSRRGIAKKEVTNLNKVIREYLQSPEFQDRYAEHPGVKIETNLQGDLLNLIGSPVHLSKTVMNLVTNALEAMPEGGIVTISTENTYIDQARSKYLNIKEGDYVLLEVTDTGVGIEQKDIDRIFEPFYTKKEMGRSGTGLGMAVVWGTVKDHDGYIDVKSKVGRGTTFTVYFPATRDTIEKKEERTSGDKYRGKGETILVVDDVADQREIAISILKQLGYKAYSVSSGEEALRAIKDNHIDLVILDMVMDPGMDGLDTYRKILEIKPGQKALIVSGYSQSKRVKEAQNLGAGAYIKKPYLMQNIARAVRQELDRKG